MKNLSSNQKIVYVAILSALGFLLTYFSVPYAPVPYLKIEFSEIVVLIGLLISPAAAFTIAVVKALLEMLAKGSNIIGIYSLMMGSFTIILSYMLGDRVLFKGLKQTKRTILSLVVVAIIFVVVMCLNNFFIVDPLYNNKSVGEFISEMTLTGYISYILSQYLVFNLLKMSYVCIGFFIVKQFLLRTKSRKKIDLDSL